MSSFGGRTFLIFDQLAECLELRVVGGTNELEAEALTSCNPCTLLAEAFKSDGGLKVVGRRDAVCHDVDCISQGQQ